MEKSSLDTQKQETKIRELYETARSLVSELRMVYILVKNNFDIKLIDGKNKRPDIEFIKNGLKADLKYSLPYNFSNLETNSCYTNENIKKDLLITARHYCREGDLKKADMIIINSSDLYFQNIFLGFTNVALPVKDAIERAFEIVNSGEKAIVQFRLPMLFSPREVEARKVFAFVMGESSIPFVKSSELRVHEIRPNKA